MANDEKKQEEVLARATKATTKRIKVKLDQIRFDTERYCHRDPEALGYESLASLMDSIASEGMQVPIEIFVDGDGKHILVKGHRRVSACRGLAEKNVPGFALDMDVDALQVENSTEADRLLRSILDNEVRLNLDRKNRIRIAKKLYDAGVPVERAARALGVSVKTYERDLLIAKNDWSFSTSLTAASRRRTPLHYWKRPRRWAASMRCARISMDGSTARRP